MKNESISWENCLIVLQPMSDAVVPCDDKSLRAHCRNSEEMAIYRNRRSENNNKNEVSALGSCAWTGDLFAYRKHITSCYRRANEHHAPDSDKNQKQQRKKTLREKSNEMKRNETLSFFEFRSQTYFSLSLSVALRVALSLSRFVGGKKVMETFGLHLIRLHKMPEMLVRLFRIHIFLVRLVQLFIGR